MVAAHQHVAKVLVRLVERRKLTPRELRNVVIAGFKGSFFPGSYSEKRTYVRKVIDRYEALATEAGIHH